MARTWTFGRKLGWGLGTKAVLTLLLSVVAVYALHRVIQAKDEVIEGNARIVADLYRIEGTVLDRMGTVRAYLLTGDEGLTQQIRDLRATFFTGLTSIDALAKSPEERELLDLIRNDTTAQFDAGDQVAAMRGTPAQMVEMGKAFQDRVIPLNRILIDHINSLLKLERSRLAEAEAEASGMAQTAITAVVAFAALSVLIAAFLAFFLTRVLSRQIGTAVNHIQSSSSELQAAANQQTAGAREQVASMTEISTTIKQLLSTARQIADSAQGVVRIADSATEASRKGDDTVRRTQGEVAAIRRQVDLVVDNMLDLGHKSQEIGGILEIINELAEQTNILAINATIEAAGAGESGRRFSVVADEIRKLADRVGGSTREIRDLIEQIRGAVNAAVMATESGSKAVDAGTRGFGDVTAAFGQIGELLRSTSEVAKEIELSTKQQSSAVEQVNVAVASVAQSSREAEASSGQVLQTVAELTSLSRDLGRLVQAGEQG